MPKRSPIFVYSMPPIDHFTHACHLIDAVAELEVDDPRAAGRLLIQFADAVAQARHSSWEGEIREGPFLLTLPGDVQMSVVGFVWKQDNNGTTYVVSSVELPYLSEFLEYRA